VPNKSEASDKRPEESNDAKKTEDEDIEYEADDVEQQPVTLDDEASYQAAGYPPKPSRLEELIPKVRKTNYEHFKNYYKPDDTRYIIQSLYAGSSLRPEILKEKKRRAPESSKGKSSTDMSQDESSSDDRKVLHRIRIHSPCITHRLYQSGGEVCKAPWRPLVFCRPFKPLIHSYQQLKEALEKLEEHWREECPPTPISACIKDDVSVLRPLGIVEGRTEKKAGEMTARQNGDNTSKENVSHKDQELVEDPRAKESSDNAEDMLDSKGALIHMRVYVKFIEEEVLTLATQFQTVNSTKIMFSDLWYLFREGELVYSPVPTNKKRSPESSFTGSSSSLMASYQTSWKVYSIITPENPSDPDSIDNNSAKDDAETSRFGSDEDHYDEEGTTRIYCYYIDFNGESYGPVQRVFRINRYEGERDIKLLPLYPVRFLSDEMAFRSGQKTIGETFKARASAKNIYHFGWTLTHGVTGSTIDDVGKYPQHIDSEVIVDLVEAFQTWPSWRPEFHVPAAAQTTGWYTDSCGEDSILSYRWSPDRKGQHHLCMRLNRRDDVALKRRNQYIEKDHFLTESRKGDYFEPSGDDVLLLPKRLVVYSLRERKFFHVEISCLKPLQLQSNVFESLKINEHHKKMVRSLVREHLRKKKQKHDGREVINQDLIRGKGAGLVFLLHGVPGVGKTATAEAIAQENKKPLFAITCGDLGFEPTDVEKNLTDIFHLADLWECILLLDEADIFFTKRSPTDLKRNALVSGKSVLQAVPHSF